MDVLGSETDLQPRALEEYQFLVMANPNDALLFWSDHAIQSDHARQESAGMDDSQPRTDAIVPGLGELAVLGPQREGDRDSRQGEEEAEVAVRSMVRRSRGPGALAVARVDRQLPPMDPTVTVPAVRSAALPSQISGTGKGIEVGDAYATRAPDSEDDDPSESLA